MKNYSKSKVKTLEIAYRTWLKKIFKAFDQYTLSEIQKSIESDKNLTPEMVEYFYSKINFDPINKTFSGVLNQNEKAFETNIKNILENISKGKKNYFVKSNQDLFLKQFPQYVLSRSLTPGEIREKQISFFELEKDIIKSELINNYTKRKNQLEAFRQSFLFNTPDKMANFKEKYPEPKFKFADTTGRTEVNNLNRDLSAVLATNMGAQEFTWVTSGDERVRESHRKLNNKKFRYDDMPPEYNDYNCRCTLVPVLSSIPGLEELGDFE